MTKYLKMHEKYMQEILANQKEGYDWNKINQFHQMQISFLQHERLIHLLVTLFIGLFFLISVFFTIQVQKIELIPLDCLLLVLLVPYTIHYYHLENGVQRLYQLANEVYSRMK